jgi:hypothetical protein
MQMETAPREMGGIMTDPALAQRAYTTILQHFVDHGRGPHYTELALALGISTEEARQAQDDAIQGARIGCWKSPLTDYIGSVAPFSNLPTQYLISVDGVQKWYGQ